MISSNRCIHTVLGEMETSDLGICQCHEHLFIREGTSSRINPALYMDDLNSSLQDLVLYRESGGCSLVDAQPVGCGRMANSLREASAQSAISVIASTGFHKLLFYPKNHWIHRADETKLTDLFVSEISRGMFDDGDDGIPKDRTTAKAGIIKTALTIDGINGSYEVLFHAAVNASISTGAPIMVHVDQDAPIVEAIRKMDDWGIPSTSLICCHLDRAVLDIGIHREIACSGSFLEYDTIARDKYHNDEKELEILKYMINSGLTDHLLLSLDTTRERLKGYGGKIGLDYLLTEFIPKAKNAGIAKAQMNSMLINNPIAALTF